MSLGLGDDEECEALQAALAFIDEYGNDLFSDESSSSSRESHTTKHNSNNVTRHSKQTNRISRNTAGTTSLPRPRTKQQLPRRNRSRDRQRLEILQLRAEAQVLQNRIADMKRKQQAADAEDVIVDVMNPTFDQDNGLLFGVWKDLAKKYRRLRKESEAENQHLCGVYTHQVATIETLRRLLQTQEQVKRTLRFPKSYCGQSFFYVDDNALVALDRLHGDLEQLYADTDLALLSTGLEAFTSPCSRTNSSPVTDNSTYVDVLLSRIVPFDYKEVADAFWHEITQNSVESAAENGHSPREMMSQAYTMELEEEGSLFKVQFRYAGRRIVDNERQVFVVSGQGQLLDAFGAVVSGVHSQEKHWLVLSELSPGVTMLKDCMSMYVHFDCELPNRQQFVDRTCEILSKVKRMGFEAVLQGVEQSLLVNREL